MKVTVLQIWLIISARIIPIANEIKKEGPHNLCGQCLKRTEYLNTEAMSFRI